jgi:hypothetical protein
MKKRIVLSGLILATLAGATVCEQSYHLQSAYQVVLTGHSPADLVPGARMSLDKSMKGAALLHDSTDYRVLTDWEGSCDPNYLKRELKFAHRKKGEKQFAVETTNDYWVKYYNGEYPHKKPGWDEAWFGFASSVTGGTVSLYDAIGKSKATQQFYSWYGTLTLKQSLRGGGGVLTGETSTAYYREITSFPDSAALRGMLVDNLKVETKSDPKDLEYTLQMIYAIYDSIPSPVSISVPKRTLSGFQSSQTGNMVLVQLGEKNRNPNEPLSLYSMMGHKIAALHPTGYAYQWNGKTLSGADAQTGVYFVQAGNRILGKFFYSR